MSREVWSHTRVPVSGVRVDRGVCVDLRACVCPYCDRDVWVHVVWSTWLASTPASTAPYGVQGAMAGGGGGPASPALAC